MTEFKQYFIKEGWFEKNNLKENNRIAFCNDENVILWLFEPDIQNIEDTISQTYENLMKDLNLNIEEIN